MDIAAHCTIHLGTLKLNFVGIVLLRIHFIRVGFLEYSGVRSIFEAENLSENIDNL